MTPIRVLVVDDSTVVRRLVSSILDGDPEIEVVATAATGRIALAKLDQVNPDLVTLDIEMPDMDGLATLAELRRTNHKMPVIMFSTLTELGATSTLEALSLGASDYVTKPSNTGSQEASAERVREQLIPKIKALVKRAPSTGPRSPLGKASTGPARTAVTTARPAARPQHVDVVTIGVSTGGPNALAALLPRLPADFPVPILIVQHMPPMFTRLLAERLDTTCALSVREAAEPSRIEPGQVWLAPGDYHLVVARRGTEVWTDLEQGAPENSCRPAVDVLFRSVAMTYGAGTLAVVLTGMGQDGLRGVEAVLAAGGRALAQDEETSVVWGMPGYVARAGLADRVLPLDVVANELTSRVANGRRRGPTAHPFTRAAASPLTEVGRT